MRGGISSVKTFRMRQLITAGLLLFLTFAPFVEPQCTVKRRPFGVLDRRLPNILAFYTFGYKLSAEVNRDGDTLVFTEYYSYLHNRGYLETRLDNETVQVYYSGDMDEAFMFKGDVCATTKLDAGAPFLSGTRLLTLHMLGKVFKIAGPSSLLVRAAFSYNLREKNKPVYQGSSSDVRGIRTMRWDYCLNDDEPPYVFYFADPSWDNGYGNTRQPLPVRMRQGTEYTEVMQMQPYMNDVDHVFQIPQGKGCTRIYNNPLKKPPTFGNLTMSFHAELMFSNPSVNGLYHYISHLDIVNDPSSKHFSLSYTPWNTATSAKSQLTPGVEFQEIYDSSNGISYHIQKEAPRCSISNVKTIRPLVRLPDNSTMAVLDFLIPSAAWLKDAVYLGRQMERGLAVEVFEVTKQGMFVGTVFLQQVVVTYSYLAGSAKKQLTQSNLPVKVEISAYTAATKLYYRLAANIHHVDLKLRELHEKLSIASCYSDDKAGSIWLQITFTGQSVPYSGFLIESAPEIKDKFRTEFLRITKLSPLRVPRVLVDFADATVYVTALVLERPLLAADYRLMPSTGISQPDWSAGVMTLDDCFKECSSRDFAECSAVAYCGASCYATTASDPEGMKSFQPSPVCNAYIKTDRASQRKLPLLAEAIEDIKSATTAGDFVLTIKYPSSWIIASNLVAVSVQDSEGQFGNAFGIPEDARRLRRKGPDMEGFVTSLGMRHKVSSPNLIRLGRYTLADCAEICTNRADCEAFTSCLATSECSISSVHSADPSQLNEDVRCSVFSKIYSDSFRAYEGISLDMTADKSFAAGNVEDCARRCVTDNDVNCKSFDFCPLSRNPATKCRIHSTHLRDLTDPSKVVKSAVESCTHFAKVFLSDFQKIVGVRSKRPTATTIRNVTAEECAKLCRESVFDCRSFDFCSGGRKGVGTCIQHQAGEGTVMDAPTCNSYIYTADPDSVVVVSDNQEMACTGYKKSTAAGLAVLLLLIGIGLGVAALVAYNTYKHKKATAS